MRVAFGLPPRLGFYVCAVVLAGTAAILHSIVCLWQHPSSTAWVILAALTLFSGSFTVKVPSISARISVSETFVFTAILMFGGAPGTLIVALDGLIISITRRNRRLHRVLFNTAEPALSVWIASLVFSAVAGAHSPVSPTTSFTQLILPVFVLAGTYFSLNSWLTAIAVSLETRTSAATVWRHHFLWLSLNYFGGASVAILLAQNVPGLAGGAVNVVLPALSVILPLLVISYLTFKTAMGRVQDATEHVSELNSLYLSTLETLAMAIDAKDQVTHGHIRRVQAWAVRLARDLGIRDDSLLQAIEAAALLHDIGKIGVPEHILNKPGKLTAAEFETMKLHASIGADLVATIHFRDLVVPIVRHHHENWNGSGYPDGLSGTAIPIGARILSVVDCYDALTSDRPYRRRLADDEAVSILVERRGVMYDPLVVDAFLGIRSELCTDVAPTADLPAVTTLATLEKTPLKSSVPVSAPMGERTVTSSQILELHDITTGLSGRVSLSFATVFISRHLRQLLPADTCVFFLYDSSTDRLNAVHVDGHGESALSGLSATPGKGVTGWVAVNRQSIANADAALDLRPTVTPLAPPLLSCLSAPLVTDKELIGVLSLYSLLPVAFTEEHRRLLDMVCPQISRTVRDAVEFDKAHAFSYRDKLTGLPNLSRLVEFVRDENVTNDGRERGLGVAMLEVRNLRALEQQYGRLFCDSLLGHVADVMSRALRATDILFKADGGEFVILLNESDAGIAEGIVARIKQHLRHEPFIQQDGTPFSLTVGIGVALQERDGRSCEELVQVARQRVSRRATLPPAPSTAIH